ncbi:MAG: hypothetical protein HN778_02115 [Prolixibacteraceae bacterium]|jgi:hypothetical protein|nr:hypothetical protein [Prolixibacteraceae bacterium]MBT6763799.1 hypothetical protein [Prolixibacteraceae bacterium]MBT7000370.1 hypothetical protein [Prolixibacteraceae bacterium]MBT7393606.1 hypothetical protein [Prolixibacteraceae bacterium]
MGENNRIRIVYVGLILLSFNLSLVRAQSNKNDTVIIEGFSTEKKILLNDSLKNKEKKGKLLQLFNDIMISPPRPYVDKKALALDYYSQSEGKIISKIDITALDVFGPSFEDTTKKAKSWIERTSNSIHTKSNLKTIKRLLLFNVGDSVNSELMYENERIIRALPYIKDLKIVLEQDSIFENQIKIHVITKDRFSLGVSGGVNGITSAALEAYNQNIFGVGHEISFRFVGHLQRRPYMGLETFYKINNVRGKFIDISAGYMNTYKKEGYSFILNKPFITPSVKWGYGASALRMYRTDRIFEDDPIITVIPMDLSFYSAWAGRSFQIKPNDTHNSQMVVSAGFYNRTYFQRPIPSPLNNQYFSNSTFYITGLTFTQRRFIQDQLVYSYGIIEDIPEGFKNEIVYGFDANEFGDRHYAHIFLSNGNLLINRKGYLYMSGGIGGYFKRIEYEQGQIQGGVNFISRQINAGRKRLRLFVRANYTVGIRRFEIENLDLHTNNYIRGFSSKEVIGKQRLSLNLEHVLFLRRELYKFNIAFFGFADLGVIGSNKQLIFTQDYYSGLGFGLRLHNENLVFKTFHLRLAFYPLHPNDMNFVGFVLDEQLKQNFYNFEPGAPLPLRFE